MKILSHTRKEDGNAWRAYHNGQPRMCSSKRTGQVQTNGSVYLEDDPELNVYFTAQPSAPAAKAGGRWRGAGVHVRLHVTLSSVVPGPDDMRRVMCAYVSAAFRRIVEVAVAVMVKMEGWVL